MVYSFVEEREGLEMLKDERVLAATVDVSGRFESKAEVWIIKYVGAIFPTSLRHSSFMF